VAIGTDNLGLQLDSWHWFNAGETERDLLTLRSQDILTIDLNDAPAGVPMDKLQDDRRELPAASGVIPIKEFIAALLKIGYDGPVQAEPFNAALAAMPIEQACVVTHSALQKALGIAGTS
jgi:sugar phosphate isomerase/epimerase